jgi:hypothetical protein
MTSQGQSQQSVLEWSLPIVHDCLREFYVAYFPLRSAGFKFLTTRHFALWTALVHGDHEAARADRFLLEQKASELNFDVSALSAANRYVAAEVLDLSLRRFRRMPNEAKANNAGLLGVLTYLRREDAPHANTSSRKRAA